MSLACLHTLDSQMTPQINGFPLLVVEHLYVTFGDSSCIDYGGKKGKERKRIYIAPFIYYVYVKALRHGSHSFTCKYTMPSFPSYAFIRWRHL